MDNKKLMKFLTELTKNELRKTEMFTDEQLQRMYDKRVEADRECDEDEP